MNAISSLTLGDFSPWNQWEENPAEENFDIQAQLDIDLNQKNKDGTYRLREDRRKKVEQLNGKKVYITDKTTGKRYLNAFSLEMRIQNFCFSLMMGLLGGALYHALRMPLAPGKAPMISAPLAGAAVLTCMGSCQLINAVIKTVKIITFFHFWTQREGEEGYNFKARLGEATKDLLRILATPLAIISLQLNTIYGIFRPRDALKLRMSIEQAYYDKSLTCLTAQEDFHPLRFLVSFGKNDNEYKEIRQRINDRFPMIKAPLA